MPPNSEQRRYLNVSNDGGQCALVFAVFGRKLRVQRVRPLLKLCTEVAAEGRMRPRGKSNKRGETIIMRLKRNYFPHCVRLAW